ncbi:putative sugar phosphate/phosphate translocator [Symbiodinium microadriaticum]|uniref:Putative sugar phosphate/phosphate translocator n=1 Tax=Symbiodinium microadriaticum TaxID=2951 RepID=A0A1Q9CCV0_SYMMI|nr:putative sugar phosphate/phosphate translocator [Symbiodinium microadriaticum]
MPSGLAPPEEHVETKQGTWRRQLETAAVVTSWFVLNIAIASSTKWIFVHGNICFQDRGCTRYQFPVAITVIHMIFSWLLCRVYIFQFRGGLEGKSLGLAQQAREIMPLSLCFALSVAMGNLSLKYIYPSFNQMLGSMSPLITVLLAVVMQQKRFPLKTWLSMPVICVGLAVCSVKELNFNALGAFYAGGATVLRAVKSLIQGRLLSTSHQMDSVTLLYYMAPWAAMWLSLIMLVLEAPMKMPSARFVSVWPGMESAAELALAKYFSSCLNACLLNIANFLVTSYTSPVTLQVLGNVKSCLSIAVSVAIFRNSLTLEQALGVCTCLVGVWMYNQKASDGAAPVEMTCLGRS